MRRPGERRLEAAAHLVLALRARLEALDAALDAELDALVIAGLEVQAVVVGGRAPVASDRAPPATRRRSLPRPVAAGPVHRDLDHERLAERACDLAEECPGQVGLVAVAQEGVAVQVIDAVEEALVEVAAEARLEADSGLGHAAALAPRLLALLRREGLEVVLEASCSRGCSSGTGSRAAAASPRRSQAARAGSSRKSACTDESRRLEA